MHPPQTKQTESTLRQNGNEGKSKVETELLRRNRSPTSSLVLMRDFVGTCIDAAKYCKTRAAGAVAEVDGFNVGKKQRSIKQRQQ